MKQDDTNLKEQQITEMITNTRPFRSLTDATLKELVDHNSGEVQPEPNLLTSKKGNNIIVHMMGVAIESSSHV